MKLKCRINPGSTVALHTSPVEVTQTSITTHTEKFLLHMTFLYCLHPFHGLNKYWGAIRWLLFHFTASFIPLETWFSFPTLMGNYVFLWSNNSSAFLTPVYKLRFGCGFHLTATRFSHLYWMIKWYCAWCTLNEDATCISIGWTSTCREINEFKVPSVIRHN